ncbi:5-formyltetrahydrofolate cyclo-ligase [Antrihabitans cavernicola]|uniref:5-formyltetrahydrofolate cyclo-ligase n=1 Tax=Antrihabitans cavernicola TaxID=2495913 RepID=A0A5A7SEN8_9NOCA|nr:5-formyltetrahydrofolate cyclo-ligase [Spelaeibacter cavernicola]KAA0024316.1 5-formyltetrahydrofolate cyclo-ligase [Spelaeibacter cavernicola]
MQRMSKQEWRRHILAARSTVSAAEHAADAHELGVAARDLVTPGSTVCAYMPIGTEPGSPQLLELLIQAGARVLLPIARDPGPLSWAEFTATDNLIPARFGLREPDGPVFAPAEIRTAANVLVPALAVDRRGVRLGRGAGFYDRTLSLADPETRLIAVVRDTELVAELPEEAHDARMGWSLTPRGGLAALG